MLIPPVPLPSIQNANNISIQTIPEVSEGAAEENKNKGEQSPMNTERSLLQLNIQNVKES